MRGHRPTIPSSWILDERWPVDFRQAALVAPAEGICDEPCICLRINVRWSAFIAGALHVLEVPQVWAGTEVEQEAAIQQVMELLDNMGCQCGEPCDCSLIAQISIVLAAQIELTLEGLDDGTVGSFAPDAPDTTWDTDSGDATQAEIDRRDAALCWAVAQYLAEILRLTAAQVNEAGALAQVVGTILTFFSPPIGLVVGLTGLLTKTFFQALVNDPAAVQKVICCMYDGLTGEAVNFDTFQASLDDCGFTFGTNEAQIAGLVAQLNADEANYRVFTRFVGKAFTTMPDAFDAATCICEECWTESGDCNDKQCIETLDGTYDCTSFDQDWVSVDAVNPQRIETTIRFPSTYVRRTGLVTDAFIGVVNKVLNIYVNGDASTGELIYTEPFTENVPTFRETLVERAVDQITWEITADPAPTNGIRCFNQTICSRDPVFPLVTCEP